jgi:hypothetical protein
MVQKPREYWFELAFPATDIEDATSQARTIAAGIRFDLLGTEAIAPLTVVMTNLRSVAPRIPDYREEVCWLPLLLRLAAGWAEGVVAET